MNSHILTALLAAALLSSASAASDVVNGYSLGSVSYHGGKVSFVKDLNWAWSRRGHHTEHLRLVGRDEWSLYFCGSSKSYSLITDFWTKKILLNKKHIAKITSGSTGIINGRNIGTAVFSTGVFKHVAPKSWTWTNSHSAAVVSFNEVGRDEWSVYLRSAHGKMFVQIDYHRKWISFKAEHGKKYDVYKITGADYSKINYRSSC